jgi:hypothetical protein
VCVCCGSVCVNEGRRGGVLSYSLSFALPTTHYTYNITLHHATPHYTTLHTTTGLRYLDGVCMQAETELDTLKEAAWLSLKTREAERAKQALMEKREEVRVVCVVYVCMCIVYVCVCICSVVFMLCAFSGLSSLIVVTCEQN